MADKVGKFTLNLGRKELMKFPPEMMRAFFPDDRHIGSVILHTPTLAHMVFLNFFDCIGELDGEKAIIAAWILSHKSEDVGTMLANEEIEDLQAWYIKQGLDGDTLAPIVMDVLRKAFRALVKKEEKADVPIFPTGYGWPLEVAETACAEYGWTFNDVIHMPVATLFALISCCNKRKGSEKGPDYYARIMFGY